MTRHGRRKRALFAGLLIVTSATGLALGIWQLERRAWKLALIDAVTARVHVPPLPAPGPDAWPRITAASDAYRHVQVRGTFAHKRSTRVEAMTGRGPGKWLMTPLRTAQGWTVLVNRGFLPDGGARPAEPAGVVVLSGLVRMTEPGGAFLRSNRPEAERWYSRDVAAIAVARHLGPVAPYFIDADAAPKSGGFPMGGLTVVTFRNAHLAYAITWFILAALSAWGAWRVLREP